MLALLLCYVQQRFSLVHLDAETYYIDTVPIQFNWLYWLLLNLGVLAVSSIIIFGSSYLMGIQKPAQTIRWE